MSDPARIAIAIEVVVAISVDELRAYLADYGETPTPDTTENLIVQAIVRPDVTPLDCGYRLLNKTAEIDPNSQRYIIRINAEVFDLHRVAVTARECYQTTWQDDDWRPKTLGEALFEILIASNQSPSPDIAGYEIIEHSAPIDHDLTPKPVTTTLTTIPMAHVSTKHLSPLAVEWLASNYTAPVDHDLPPTVAIVPNGFILLADTDLTPYAEDDNAPHYLAPLFEKCRADDIRFVLFHPAGAIISELPTFG
jgi:hypothetical protein